MSVCPECGTECTKPSREPIRDALAKAISAGFFSSRFREVGAGVKALPAHERELLRHLTAEDAAAIRTDWLWRK